MPPPYEDVEIGEEIPINAFWKQEDVLVCEAIYRGDNFGGVADLTGLRSLERTLEIDNLVGGVASLVWNELYGVPVFRDEDEEFVGRVAARAAWATSERRSTQGYVKSVKGGEPPPAPARDVVAAAVGDADVTELRLTQEEMAALMRGEIPEALTERLLRARSTENLIASVEQAILTTVEEGAEFPDLDRAVLEIREIRRRFTHA